MPTTRRHADTITMRQSNPTVQRLIAYLSNLLPPRLPLKPLTRTATPTSAWPSVRQDSIAELLVEHPPDDIDEEGLPFWSGVRRLPILPKLDETKDDQVGRGVFTHLSILMN